MSFLCEDGSGAALCQTPTHSPLSMLTAMQFGKAIEEQRVPEWAAGYVDYKGESWRGTQDSSPLDHLARVRARASSHPSSTTHPSLHPPYTGLARAPSTQGNPRCYDRQRADSKVLGRHRVQSHLCGHVRGGKLKTETLFSELLAHCTIAPLRIAPGAVLHRRLVSLVQFTRHAL